MSDLKGLNMDAEGGKKKQQQQKCLLQFKILVLEMIVKNTDDAGVVFSWVGIGNICNGEGDCVSEFSVKNSITVFTANILPTVLIKFVRDPSRFHLMKSQRRLQILLYVFSTHTSSFSNLH